MNIYTTHYFLNGLRWSGQRILAISWQDAEYIASIKGLELTGRLIMEIPVDNENNPQWENAIDYEKLNNN